MHRRKTTPNKCRKLDISTTPNIIDDDTTVMLSVVQQQHAMSNSSAKPGHHTPTAGAICSPQLAPPSSVDHHSNSATSSSSSPTSSNYSNPNSPDRSNRMREKRSLMKKNDFNVSASSNGGGVGALQHSFVENLSVKKNSYCNKFEQDDDDADHSSIVADHHSSDAYFYPDLSLRRPDRGLTVLIDRRRWLDLFDGCDIVDKLRFIDDMINQLQELKNRIQLELVEEEDEEMLDADDQPMAKRVHVDDVDSEQIKDDLPNENLIIQGTNASRLDSIKSEVKDESLSANTMTPLQLSSQDERKPERNGSDTKKDHEVLRSSFENLLRSISFFT